MPRVTFTCHGGGEQPLKVSLRRITESKAADISKELLMPIIDASMEADERRIIMKHIRECLSELTGKRWHRIYSGMLLVQKLMDHGSHALFIELAHGHHFDLIQKVSLLEHFDSTVRGVSNPWAQDMVRKKAKELRTALVPLLERASAEELPQGAGLFIRDNTSMSGVSEASCSTAATSNHSSPSSTHALSGPGRKKRIQDGGGALVERSERLAGLSPRSRLQSELRKITESGLTDVPPEFFPFVVEASFDTDSLHTILRHLRKCFAVSMQTKWQRVHAGMALVDHLLQRGSPQFAVEATRAGDLNLVRQMWRLQEFEYRQDWRAQSLVRKKARALHDLLVQRQQQLQTSGVAIPAAAGGLASVIESRCGGRGGEANAAPCGKVGPVSMGEAFSTLRAWAETDEMSVHSDLSSRPSSDDLASEDLYCL